MHGVIGSRMAWELTGAPARVAQALSARLSWSASQPELFEVFPFQQELDYEARLADGQLRIDLTVRAIGGHAVPLVFGFHPYLTLPRVPRESWRVELPGMRRLSLDDKQIPIGPGEAAAPQRFELAEREFDDAFDEVPEPSGFAVASAGRRLELKLEQGYPCAQVFAPRTAQFICFEPMTAPANALRSSGVRLLGPGESCRTSFSIGVTEPRA